MTPKIPERSTFRQVDSLRPDCATDRSESVEVLESLGKHPGDVLVRDRRPGGSLTEAPLDATRMQEALRNTQNEVSAFAGRLLQSLERQHNSEVKRLIREQLPRYAGSISFAQRIKLIKAMVIRPTDSYRDEAILQLFETADAATRSRMLTTLHETSMTANVTRVIGFPGTKSVLAHVDKDLSSGSREELMKIIVRDFADLTPEAQQAVRDYAASGACSSTWQWYVQVKLKSDEAVTSHPGDVLARSATPEGSPSVAPHGPSSAQEALLDRQNEVSAFAGRLLQSLERQHNSEVKTLIREQLPRYAESISLDQRIQLIKAMVIRPTDSYRDEAILQLFETADTATRSRMLTTLHETSMTANVTRVIGFPRTKSVLAHVDKDLSSGSREKLMKMIVRDFAELTPEAQQAVRDYAASGACSSTWQWYVRVKLKAE